jgi:hypothetical protein
MNGKSVFILEIKEMDNDSWAGTAKLEFPDSPDKFIWELFNEESFEDCVDTGFSFLERLHKEWKGGKWKW